VIIHDKDDESKMNKIEDPKQDSDLSDDEDENCCTAGVKRGTTALGDWYEPLSN